MKAITINELYNHLKKQIDGGMGNKKILIATDEDALICDLAETYHIYDMRQFDPDYIAILAVGLRIDSRIKKRLTGVDIDINTLLLAHIVDNTAINVWAKTEDARKGRLYKNTEYGLEILKYL